MNLRQYSLNKIAKVKKLEGENVLVIRLTELGFTPNEDIRVIGKSLFGSPLYVEIRGAVIALRDREAECIQVYDE